MCGTTLEPTTVEPTPHTYDGGVFTITPNCCVLGEIKYTCLDCGEEKLVATGYNLTGHVLDTIVDIIFKLGYTQKGTYVYECSVCYEILEEEAPSFPALFTCLGYSVSQTGNGVSLGFKINNAAIQEYTIVTGCTLKYGVFAVAQSKLNDNDIFNIDGTANENAICAEIKKTEFTAFDIKVVGFVDDTQRNAPLALGAYIEIAKNGELQYSYIQDNTRGTFTGKYYVASFNQIVSE
jgi:hypothetical protein